MVVHSGAIVIERGAHRSANIKLALSSSLTLCDRMIVLFKDKKGVSEYFEGKLHRIFSISRTKSGTAMPSSSISDTFPTVIPLQLHIYRFGPKALDIRRYSLSGTNIHLSIPREVLLHFAMRTAYSYGDIFSASSRLHNLCVASYISYLRVERTKIYLRIFLYMPHQIFSHAQAVLLILQIIAEHNANCRGLARIAQWPRIICCQSFQLVYLLLSAPNFCGQQQL